jgi:hypothetical protein
MLALRFVDVLLPVCKWDLYKKSIEFGVVNSGSGEFDIVYQARIAYFSGCQHNQRCIFFRCR